MSQALSTGQHPVRTPPFERRLLLTLLVLLGASALLLIFPFWPCFVLALWTKSLACPLAERLTRITHGRHRAAGLITIGLLVLAVVPVIAGIVSVAPEASALLRRALQSTSGRGALVDLVSNPPAGAKDAGPGVDAGEVMQLARQHGKQAWSVASLLAGFMGTFVLGTFATFVATYAAMVHGDEAYGWLKGLLPLSPDRVERLRAAFQETGRGLLFSVLLTSLLLGALATVIFAALGVPRALALGFATLFASLIPAIGPFLVWGPVALGLALSGHPTRAIILAALCIAVLAPVDHVLRPFLARRGNLQLHPFVVLFAMLGGLVTIGGWGLLLGPLVFRLAVEVAYTLRDARAESARSGPPP
jgi:predicted PurR-regulated permease PerM